MSIKSYATLARWDKPVGVWLLFLPCLWGLGLAPDRADYFYYAALCFIGAFLARSAGCVYNDMLDRDFDRNVERTKNRPLASRALNMKQAALFLALLLTACLLLLIPFAPFARIVALCAVIPVAVYPLMKRFTHWPQLFLGIAFNWGVLLGAATTGDLPILVWPVYTAAIFWTLGYDTIYALQDIEDDLKIGVKSTAVAARGRVRLLVAFCYAISAILLGFTGVYGQFNPLYFLALFVVCCQLFWQVRTLDPASPKDALAKFKSNVIAGSIIAIGFYAAV